MRTSVSLAAGSALVFLSAWALAQPAKPTDPATATASDPAAVAALDACLKAVRELPAYDVRFRQEASTPHLPTIAEGRLVVAPGRRVRFELKSNQGRRGVDADFGWLNDLEDGQSDGTRGSADLSP